MHAPLPKLPAKMPAERRSVLHVVAPGLEVAQAVPRKGETVTAFLRRTRWAVKDPRYGWQFRTRLPTYLTVNGEAILRKDWRRTKIAANDNVCFISVPRGGKQGKQILGLVALVAVAAFAAWAPVGLFGLASGSLAAAGATAAIGLGGALLVNALVAPKQGATNDGTPTDQIYTAQAQGNRARLGQPMPIWYGRNKDYPDFAATPWGEFQGNDQYLNVLLSVTMGSMDYEQLLISDTPFWNPTDGVLPAFSSAQVEFYEPNAAVTLFPVNVTQSDEVTGQQLPHDYSWIGPYVANAPATTAYQIAVDYVFPAGCYTTNDDGETTTFSVTVIAERQAVDDAGAATGDWETLGYITKSYASRSPIRETLLVGVPEGRYQLRFKRTTDVPADNKGAAEVVWAGLRAYLRGDNTFPVSTIAIRIKATETTQGSYKFGVIGTRKLPVWNGSTFITQATRSPAWALLDMATNAQYGAEVQSAKIDFNTLVNHATGCATRGDSFDYVFKSAVAVPEAFDTAITPSRSRHMWLGDTLSLVRDQWEMVPTMMLTDREIVRDSTSFEYTMLGEEDPDAVIIEYIDENTWLPATVQYPPNTEVFTATRPETKRVNGIVNRNHAYRECAFYYLCSIYRREAGSIGCEYEGRAITMGQTLRLQSELPQDYGFAGAVTDNASGILTLDPAPEWATGETHYIRLRRPNGKEFGPVTVTKGDNDNEAVLDGDDLATVESQQGVTLANVLLRADGGEYPTYALGTADNQSKLVKVLTGQPNGETFTLSIVVDDERVHATDLGDPPILPVGQFPKNDSSPLIVGLNARFGQGVAEPQLTASWFPAAGAFYYRAEVSYDSGNSWVEVYQGSDTKFEKFVTLGALTLRVQAVGQFPGPWSQVAVDAPTIEIMAGSVALQSLKEGIQYQVTQALADLENSRAQLEQLIASVASVDISRNWLDKKQQRRELASFKGEATAQITELWTAATDLDAALAQTTTDLTAAIGQANSRITITNTALSDLTQSVADQTQVFNAQFGTVNASLTSEIQTRSTADGALSTRIDNLSASTNSSLATINNALVAQATTNSSVAGQLNSFSTTLNDNTASLNVISASVDGVKVQFGVTGTIDGTTGGFVFQGVRRLDGSVSYGMFIRGDVIIDGTLTGTKIQAGTINTLQLSINSVGIDQIIANAVSNVKPFYQSVQPLTITSANSDIYVFNSESVDIRSGTAIVTISGQWIKPLGGNSITDAKVVLQLNIDGTNVRRFYWDCVIEGGAYRLYQPFTIKHVQTGLSAGTHTFTLRNVKATDDSASNAFANLYYCTMLVEDFRR
jgi:hypothetical protein